MIYLGIDPGVHGGIAGIDDDGRVLWADAMPDDCIGVLASMTKWGLYGAAQSEILGTLERVSASPQMGTVSAFTFGKGFGRLEMALAAAGVKYSEVHPLKWQNALGCLTGGDKNISKRKAIELFPDAKKITHAIADSLLLAWYGRMLHQGRTAGIARPASEQGTRATAQGV